MRFSWRVLLSLCALFLVSPSLGIAGTETSCIRVRLIQEYAAYEKARAETSHPESWLGSKLKTVPELMAQGQSFEQIMEELNVPKEAQKFYDRQTGRFNYVQPNPIRLSPENGDASLSALRMNWKEKLVGNEKKISQTYFKQLIRAMEVIPSLRLWVVHGPEMDPNLATSLAELPLSIRNRIRPIRHTEKVPDVWAQDGSKPLEEGGVNHDSI